MANKCAACLKIIKDRRFLSCSVCTEKYDLDCVNVPEKRFYNTMTKEHKAAWVCPQCASNKPKQDNTNTPVRSQPEHTFSENNQLTSPCNVTQRRKVQSLNVFNEDSTLEDTLPHGDTLGNHSLVCNADNELLIEIRELKAQINLQAQKQEARDQELTDTIKLLQSCILGITTQHSNFQAELKIVQEKIETNTKRIMDLERENSRLTNELGKERETIVMDNKLTESQNVYVEARKRSEQPVLESGKVIVLYGLHEIRFESEYQLQDRVLNLFYEIAGIDLSGYIEDLVRIGRRGSRRPLKIELLSKKVTKYTLQCLEYFKGTGFWISEYLDIQGLQRRKIERENFVKTKQANLLNASRNNGFYENKQNYDRPPIPNEMPAINQSTVQLQPTMRFNEASNRSFRRQ